MGSHQPLTPRFGHGLETESRKVKVLLPEEMNLTAIEHSSKVGWKPLYLFSGEWDHTWGLEHARHVSSPMNDLLSPCVHFKISIMSLPLEFFADEDSEA